MSTQRISDKVAAQLRGLVQEHRLQPGDRLPAERTLAVQLGVSRTALREAIAQLASQGLLTARVGGGTYVAEPAARARQALDEPLAPYLPLFQGDPEYRFDVLEIRHALEGATAWHAAARATDEDRTRIAQAFQTMMDAHGKDDPTGEAEADAARVAYRDTTVADIAPSAAKLSHVRHAQFLGLTGKPEGILGLRAGFEVPPEGFNLLGRIAPEHIRAQGLPARPIARHDDAGVETLR